MAANGAVPLVERGVTELHECVVNKPTIVDEQVQSIPAKGTKSLGYGLFAGKIAMDLLTDRSFLQIEGCHLPTFIQ